MGLEGEGGRIVLSLHTWALEIMYPLFSGSSIASSKARPMALESEASGWPAWGPDGSLMATVSVSTKRRAPTEPWNPSSDDVAD